MLRHITIICALSVDLISQPIDKLDTGQWLGCWLEPPSCIELRESNLQGMTV